MRFTLAACLGLMAFAGVLCFLLTTQPSVVSYVSLIAIALFAPACAVAGIVYGRDNLRAFCIGAALPLALLVWSAVPHLQAIQLDLAAYGWSGQPAQSAPTNILTSGTVSMGGTSSMSSTMGMGGLSPGGMPGMMGNTVYIMGPTAHQVTLDHAREMTKPICSLSIAALLSGVLVMALRGALKRKEPVSSSSADK